MFDSMNRALRTTRSNWPLAGAITFTLGAAVGVNATAFGILYPALAAPIPYVDDGRMVSVWLRPANGDYVVGPSAEDFASWRDATASFEDVEIVSSESVVIEGLGEPTRVEAGRIDSTFFSFFGVVPAKGRMFTRDEAEKSERVALLSAELWRSRSYSGRAIGLDTIRINDEPHTVIGVLPDGFRVASFTDPQVWLPLSGPSEVQTAFVFARLQRGVDVKAANAELGHLSASRADGWVAHARTRRDTMGRDFNLLAVSLQIAVLVLLLIACINVAQLQAVRAMARRREFAIRAALGATPWQLLRQAAAENLVLAAFAIPLGYLIAYAARVALLSIASGTAFTYALQVGRGPILLGLGVGSVVALTLSGLAPAVIDLRSYGIDSTARLLRIGRAGESLGSGSRGWAALIAMQIALSMTLLIGAGLLVRSLERLMTDDLGFNPAGVAALSINLDGNGYPSAETQIAFRDLLLTAVSDRFRGRVDSVALVAGSATGSSLLLGSLRPLATIAGGADLENVSVSVAEVSPDYFRALGISVVEGNTFTRDYQLASTFQPVLINVSLARRMWGRLDVVGDNFEFYDGFRTMTYRVIGLTADTKLSGARAPYGSLQLFTPLGATAQLVVLLASDRPEHLLNELKEQVWDLDPDLAVYQAGVISDLVGENYAENKLHSLLMGILGALAFTLTLVGIYGSLSRWLAVRLHETGIRLLLGSSRARATRHLVGWGLGSVLLGVVLGTAGGLLIGQALKATLYGVGPMELSILVGTATAVLLASLLACLLPALRVVFAVSAVSVLKG